jgi:hypothetical protein
MTTANTAPATTATAKNLRYFSGNIGLGIDTYPKGEWENGIFTLGEDDGAFLAGEKFVLSEEDCYDQQSLNDGTGGYNLEACR